MTSTTFENPNQRAVTFWQRLVSWLIEPSSAIETREDKHQAQLMSGLTLATFVLSSIRVIVGLRSGSYLTDASFFLYYLLLGALAGAYVFSRTKYITFSTLIYVVGLSSLVYGVVIVRGSSDPIENLSALIWILPGFTFGAMHFSYWVGILWMTGNFIALLMLPQIYPGVDSSSLSSLLYTIFVLSVLNMVLNRYRHQIEIERAAHILATNRELQVLNTALEERVEERTKALQTSTEVGRRLSTILDPDQLALEVVEEVKSAFHYYHAHIYLLDDTGQTLKMVGGTGGAGQIMLERGHSIPLERGLVGRAARTNTPVLVPDTENEHGWLPNLLLPETKAEIAVPIAFGETVLGVLDVQHNVVNGLTEADVELLQTIASQVAVALQNAYQYELVRARETALRESEERYRLFIEYSGEAIYELEFETKRLKNANQSFLSLLGYTLEEIRSLTLYDIVAFGKDKIDLVLERAKKERTFPVGETKWRRKDGALVDVYVNLSAIQQESQTFILGQGIDITHRKQIQQALEKRAERDRVLARISSKIRGAVNMEQVLQIATLEVRQALGASRSVVIIDPNEDTVSMQPVTYIKP